MQIRFYTNIKRVRIYSTTTTKKGFQCVTHSHTLMVLQTSDQSKSLHIKSVFGPNDLIRRFQGSFFSPLFSRLTLCFCVSATGSSGGETSPVAAEQTFPMQTFSRPPSSCCNLYTRLVSPTCSRTTYSSGFYRMRSFPLPC